MPKRSHEEAEASSSRNDGSERRHSGKKHQVKRQKLAPDANMSAIKKRARNIERRFEHDKSNIPADVLKELERELAALKQRIAEEKFKRQRSKMISKYHMVRFFERKKAMRLAKQLKRRLEETTDPEEIAQIKADLHIAEVDLDYALYYPFLEPYISLYPKAPSEKTDEKSTAAHNLHNPRPLMWSTIEKAREEGKSALEKIRDRRSETDSTKTEEIRLTRPIDPSARKIMAKPAQKKKDRGTAEPKNRAERRKAMAAEKKMHEEENEQDSFFDEE